jgi:hypothetical protein
VPVKRWRELRAATECRTILEMTHPTRPHRGRARRTWSRDFKNASPDDRFKITRGNVAKLYGFEL